jgi:hypothetical protein
MRAPFSVPLTTEEIEEDIYSLTGARRGARGRAGGGRTRPWPGLRRGSGASRRRSPRRARGDVEHGGRPFAGSLLADVWEHHVAHGGVDALLRLHGHRGVEFGLHIGDQRGLIATQVE